MPLVHNASSSSARLCVCWLRTLAAFGRRDRVGGAAAATAVRRAARAAWRRPPAGSSQASCGRAPAPLRLRWRWPAQCVPAARGYFPAPLRPSCRGRSTWRRSTGRGRSACAASWKTCSCGRVRRGRCRRRRLTMVSERSLGVGIGALVHLMGCRAAQSGSRARARSRRKVECAERFQSRRCTPPSERCLVALAWLAAWCWCRARSKVSIDAPCGSNSLVSAADVRARNSLPVLPGGWLPSRLSLSKRFFTRTRSSSWMACPRPSCTTLTACGTAGRTRRTPRTRWTSSSTPTRPSWASSLTSWTGRTTQVRQATMHRLAYGAASSRDLTLPGL